MKTTVEISGQIMGNGKLARYVQLDWHKTMFYGYRADCSTKKEARNAIKDAYKEMKNDGFEVQTNKYHEALHYDASICKIINNKV